MEANVQVIPTDNLFMCDVCAVRHLASEKPHSLVGSMWRLHTRVCPMWNSYREVTGAESPSLSPKDKTLAVALVIGTSMILLRLFRKRR